MNKNEQIWEILSKHLDESYKEYVLDIFDQCFDYSPLNAWNSAIADLIKLMESRSKWIDDVDYKVKQVKVKFGSLRFYVEGGDDYLYGAIAMLEKQTNKLCPHCGSYNKEKIDSGRYIKKCEDCPPELE
jgi:hypothetical protein